MKELAVYFKKRMKDQETIPKLWTDHNYGEDVEYNIEHEIENRKMKLVACLNKLNNNNNIKNQFNHIIPSSLSAPQNSEEINKTHNFNLNRKNEVDGKLDDKANNNINVDTVIDNYNINNISENHYDQINEKTGSSGIEPLTQSKLVESELKLLKAYNFQKKLRRDVVMNFINEFDKHSTVYYSDVLFHKTLLDRRFYKKQPQSNLVKKETRLSDKFEQQLRVGIDFRKRDKHLEFLNSIIQHQKDFMEFHKAKRVKTFFLILKNY